MRRTRPLSREWRFRRARGSKGSRWITYKVLYKDGKEVSREQDHKTTYKGHAPVIRRNTIRRGAAA
ncbi:MAG: G5 domain-containing protein [Enterocloster bolteae]